MSGARATLLPGFYIVGPVYEAVHHLDGTLFTCEKHADGRLVDCKIDDRLVTPHEYVDRKDAWKNG